MVSQKDETPWGKQDNTDRHLQAILQICPEILCTCVGWITIKKEYTGHRKNTLKIIFGAAYTSYEDLLIEIDESSLKERRDELSLKFAQKFLKNDKFCDWFPLGVSTRGGSHFFEAEAKTKRLKNSAIPYMTRLLNQN